MSEKDFWDRWEDGEADYDELYSHIHYDPENDYKIHRNYTQSQDTSNVKYNKDEKK